MTELLYVCKYTDFASLAHAPRGSESLVGIDCFKVNQVDGDLKLLNTDKTCYNPAFARFDPVSQTLYICTESINDDGQIVAFSVDSLGSMTPRSMQTAKGTSTCYLTLDQRGRNLLFVNYWDSSLGSIPINDNGELHPVRGFIRPARVNSKNRDDHLANRQLEPHAHAIVLDPFMGGNLAFVPDLGRDCIRQYRYNSDDGSFKALNEIPSCTGPGPHGPRYIEFHQSMEIGYVVNELSSFVSVFRYDRGEVEETINSELDTCTSLELIQTISTVPDGYTDYNTCGRVTVEKTGNFVLVSNRGHDSICVYRIDRETGLLSTVGIFSTMGETPRHFQLSSSGELLCVANQDTDTLVMFHFNQETGELTHTGRTYGSQSPNFVCFVNLPERSNSCDDSGKEEDLVGGQ